MKPPRRPSLDEWIKELWCIYAMESYSDIKRNAREPVLRKWVSLELVIQSAVSQKEKNKHHIFTRIYGT